MIKVEIKGQICIFDRKQIKLLMQKTNKTLCYLKYDKYKVIKGPEILTFSQFAAEEGWG